MLKNRWTRACVLAGVVSAVIAAAPVISEAAKKHKTPDTTPMSTLPLVEMTAPVTPLEPVTKAATKTSTAKTHAVMLKTKKSSALKTAITPAHKKQAAGVKLTTIKYKHHNRHHKAATLVSASTPASAKKKTTAKV